MDIIISNSNNEPIYEQIYNQIKIQILRGDLKEGDPLPSMRYLAATLKISVITTKRAYEELERDGYIETYTGRGSFVKKQNLERFREEQLKDIENLLSLAINKAKETNVSPDEIKSIIDMFYNNGGM